MAWALQTHIRLDQISGRVTLFAACPQLATYYKGSVYLFDGYILDLLTGEMGKGPVHFVGVGAHDFQLAFGDMVRVQNTFRVDFCLQGIEYTWETGPSAIPVWLLIDQYPCAAQLESLATLVITFESGDWIRMYTEEGPNECQLFEWSRANKRPIKIQIY